MRFEPGIEHAGDIAHALVVAIARGGVIVADGSLPRLADLARDEGHAAAAVYLGTLDGTPVVALDLDGQDGLPDGHSHVGLREAHGELGELLWNVAGRGVELLHWSRDHAHCGRCGTATQADPGHRGLICPACGHVSFPRVSPCVIVLVEKDDRVLLAHGRRFPQPFFSCLAGFVDAGESAEDAVRREILEEAGLVVEPSRYLGSQPWPFPHNLMLGFRARWIEGEIDVDPEELVEARWVPRDGLDALLIPPPLSIARQMIDDWRDEG